MNCTGFFLITTDSPGCKNQPEQKNTDCQMSMFEHNYLKLIIPQFVRNGLFSVQVFLHIWGEMPRKIPLQLCPSYERMQEKKPPYFLEKNQILNIFMSQDCSCNKASVLDSIMCHVFPSCRFHKALNLAQSTILFVRKLTTTNNQQTN